MTAKEANAMANAKHGGDADLTGNVRSAIHDAAEAGEFQVILFGLRRSDVDYLLAKGFTVHEDTGLSGGYHAKRFTITWSAPAE